MCIPIITDQPTLSSSPIRSSPNIHPIHSSTAGENSQLDSPSPHLVSPTDSISSPSHLPSQNANTHSMVTRAKIGISKPKVFLTDLTVDKPSDIKEALLEKWRVAVHKEYNALV